MENNFLNKYDFHDGVGFVPKNPISEIVIDGKEIQQNNGTLNINSYPFYKLGLRKISTHLYESNIESVDYELGKKFLEKEFGTFDKFACTSVRNGNFYGRNFDWYYNNDVSFLVRTEGKNGRYKTIGMAGGIGISKLNSEFVDSGQYSELYDIMPNLLLDGINEKGVFCNINVTTNEKGITTGTNPGKERLCVIMVPRIVVDNFDNAETAANYIKNELDIYAPNVTEIHIMIGDEKNNFILEFIDNECVILSSANTTNNMNCIMTNFFITGVSTTTSGSSTILDYTTMTPYSDGYERYNTVFEKYDSINSVESMVELMTNDLKYTNTYNNETYHWLSENCGNFGSGYDFTITDVVEHPEKFTPIIEYMENKFQNRSRDENSEFYGTWQSTFSSTYDIENRQLWLTSQEGEEAKCLPFALNKNEEPIMVMYESHNPMKEYESGDLCAFNGKIYKATKSSEGKFNDDNFELYKN